MALAEVKREVKQLAFEGFYNPQYHLLKEVKKGTPSENLFRTLLRVHPYVEMFSTHSYVPHNPDEPDNKELTWYFAGKITQPKLSGLNDLSSITTGGWERKIKLLGIASKVKTGSEGILNIPMLDFVKDPEFNEKNFRYIGQVLENYPGYLLNTGNSFHYWGTRLLSEEKWKKFLTHCNDNFKGYVDDYFLEMGEKKGFTALRIFGYSEINKDEPKVVGVIGQPAY